MSIIFVSTHYNAPHFIELQLNSLKQFVKDDFQLVIMDDAADDTRSLLSGRLAVEELAEESKRLGLLHIRVPQNIHQNVSDGGLVPNGLPAGHPTERHRAHLHWILKNNKLLGLDQCDVFALIESDMFVKQEINFAEYMGDIDIMGPGRKYVNVVKREGPDEIWPEELIGLNEIKLSYFPMYMLLVNMNKVFNLEELNIGGFAGTDTGGQTGLFVNKNPQYKYFFMEISGNKEYQIDFFSAEAGTDEEAEFAHFRGGSNWDAQSIEYYKEKINRMLKKFCPTLKFDLPEPQTNLSSRDKEHTFFKGR